MTATIPKPELKGLRWSAAVQCPRWGYYTGQPDAEREPPTQKMLGWWQRGNLISDGIRHQVFEALRADGQRPRAEEPVAMFDGRGTGHMDAFIPKTRETIEISTTAGADLQPHKAIQAAGYALRHPRAEKASVLVIDPSSTTTRRLFPLNLASLAPIVDSLERTIIDHLDAGEPPARTCRYPGEGKSRGCPYWRTCFADWEPPDSDELLALDDLVGMLVDAEQRHADAKALAADADADVKAARDELRPYLTPGEAAIVAGRRLLVSEVKGRRTISCSELAAAGHIDLVEQFSKLGEPYEKWQASKPIEEAS